MRPMQWVRLWIMPHLSEDSCWRFLNLAQRGLFKCLLVLAGHSNNGGEICLNGMPGVPYTDDQLAAILYITVEEFRSVLASMPQDMVSRNPTNQCLVVTNWSNYQTEYERRKGYKTKLHPKVTTKSNTPTSDFQKSEVRSQKSEEQKPEEGLSLAVRAYDLIFKNHPNLPTFSKDKDKVIESWSVTVSKFLKRTGKTVAEVEAFFDWAAQDKCEPRGGGGGRKPWTGWWKQFQSVELLDKDSAWAEFAQGSGPTKPRYVAAKLPGDK